MTDKKMRPRIDIIREINEWRGGGYMYPIEVASDALYWLRIFVKQTSTQEPSPDIDGLTLPDTIKGLEEWLGNAAADMPEHLVLATQYWLRKAELSALEAMSHTAG